MSKLHSRRTVAATVASLGALALIAACSPPPAADSGSSSGGASGGSGKTVTVWLQQDPGYASPLQGGSYGGDEILGQTLDTLNMVNGDGTVIPRLAKSWDVSSDAKTITIHLDGSRKWSDGTPFTADDVIWTANTMASGVTKAPQGANFKDVLGYADVKSGAAKEMTGLKKVDDQTITVTLGTADSGWVFNSMPGFYIMPKKALESQDLAALPTSTLWTTAGKYPSIGPMVMSAYLAKQRAEFTPNPNFPNPVKFGKLVESFVTQDVATQQLQSGEMDLTLVQPTDVKTVQGMNGVKTVSADSSGFDRYAVNTKKPYLANAAVRQALLTAIDRAGIINSVYAGQAKPQNSSFLAPYITTSGFQTYAHDTAKAKQMLQAAGWDPNQTLTINQVSGNEMRASINQVAVKNLQDAGIKATIKPIDQAQTNDMFTKGDWDLYLYGGGNYLADGSSDYGILACKWAFPAGANLGGFCDPAYDTVMQQAQETGDQAKRKDLYNQGAKIDNADVPLLWMARPTRVYAYSAKITGGVTAGEGMANGMRLINQWQIAG